VKSTDEQQLATLENEAFELEWDYRVDSLYTPEQYKIKREQYEMRINDLLIRVYGIEWLEDDNCACGLYHVKEEYFLHSYYNKKERE
jgi:hypothetical protein